MTGREHPVSPQWSKWRERVDLDEYVNRFAGNTSHGEAGFVEALQPSTVLDAGCGTGRLGGELHRRGIETVGVDLDPDLLARALAATPQMMWRCLDLATLELGRVFDVVVMAGNVILFCEIEDRVAVVEHCAAHVGDGGALVAGFSLRGVGAPVSLDEYDGWCAAAGLVLAERYATWDRDPYIGGDYAVSVHRRP